MNEVNRTPEQSSVGQSQKAEQVSAPPSQGVLSGALTSNPKRYHVSIGYFRGGNPAGLDVKENEAGDWVRWEDIKHLLSPAHETSGEYVRIPTSEREAELMAKLGMQWLEQHAPHRLKSPEKASAPTCSVCGREINKLHPGCPGASVNGTTDSEKP